MRKFFRLGAIFLLILALSACGGKDAPPVSSGSSAGDASASAGASGSTSTPQPDVSSPTGSSTPAVPTEPLHIPELTVELPRELDTAAARKAMQLLPEAMAGHNVTIDTVSISFGPSYAATAAALQQGTVQLAFLPAEDYLELGGMSLLLADAYPGFNSSALTRGVSTLVCAGPSDYGAKLADLAESRALTWTELDHARWGVLAADSLAGYRCLRLWLEDNYEDNAVSDLSQVTVYDSWDALLRAAAAEEIDLFPMPAELQSSYANRWSTDLARAGSFWEEVQAIGASDGVCTWVATAAPEDEAVNDPRFVQALDAVINSLFADPDEQLSAIGAEYYAAAAEADLNPLRRLLLGDG